MSMKIKENKIYIFVADSDATNPNRLEYSKNSKSETTNYCPPETENENKKFYEILGLSNLLEGEDYPFCINTYKGKEKYFKEKIDKINSELASKEIKLDARKLKEYKDAMLTKYKSKNSKLFVGGMGDFEKNCENLIKDNNKIVASKIVLTGDRPYLTFEDTEDKKYTLYKSIIYGEATVVVLESTNTGITMYPLCRPLFLSKDEVNWDNGEVEKKGKIVNIKLEEIDEKNIIFYGAPGCGKSYKIKHDYCDDENFMERVVFHPDYSYSDFVGQIYPKSIEDKSTGKKDISYPFVPGPFTRILKKAVKDEEKNRPYYLIIEEINRGNAPAIFGDIFQLLDRNDDGESEYGINNSDIAVEVYGDEEHLVKIPKNLIILATMNTADQNVFTLDTAFKRRWIMENIPINFKGHDFADVIIFDEITWENFVNSINRIIGNDSTLIGSEDKRIGPYFMKKHELEDKKRFAEKMLMYLWNDVKYKRDEIFKPNYTTLENLIACFLTDGVNVFKDGIFGKDTKDDSNTLNTGEQENE